MVAGFVISGVMLIVYSRLESVWPAIPTIALVGFAVGGLNTALFPVILQSVPRELLGRVMAVIAPANRLGAIISVGVSSVLVSTALKGLDSSVAGVHFGRIDTVFAVSGLIVIAGGVYFGLAARSPG